MTSAHIIEILKKHVPEEAVAYCYALWNEAPFELKLTRSRQTKVGDFTSKGRKSHPRITLNNDLNPYLFLQTYVHEVAHLRVYITLGNKVDPHGEEWKTMFTELMVPLLWENVFPEDILHELRRHMVNPKASSFADADLTQAFRKYDKDATRFVTLSLLPEGSIFNFQGRYFKKGKVRRTRVICVEMKSKRSYLVPIDAQVNNVQLSLL